MLLVISGRHTHTTKKERKNGPSPLFFCLICVVCCLSSGDPRRVQLPVGVGVEGRRGYTARSPLFFSWITEIESTSLCVWRARNDGGSPSEDSPAQSLLLFTINLHTFTFSLAAPGKKEGRPLARGQEEGDKITSIPPTRAICTPVHRLEINQEIDDRPRLSHEKRLVEECEIQGNKQQQKTQLCAPC